MSVALSLCVLKYTCIYCVYTVTVLASQLVVYHKVSVKFNTSGDENHLCRASLHKSHKISLKAHGHTYTHGVGTLIARPEKLPRQ